MDVGKDCIIRERTVICWLVCGDDFFKWGVIMNSWYAVEYVIIIIIIACIAYLLTPIALM